jgi:hypothetical protein
MDLSAQKRSNMIGGVIAVNASGPRRIKAARRAIICSGSAASPVASW